ncbi:MAG TPA: TMEM165/GDT1 family protein [Pseudomonadales bacterium]|nr:TMEM165/GDT1 family protein [Pseudomonadales bacterium]
MTFLSTIEPFLVSTGIVALAEIGDKTQLLSLVLAARYRQHHLAIIFGIFVSTIVNHAGAGILGAYVTHLLGPELLRWILGISFLLMAGWIMVPDKLDDDDAVLAKPHASVFITTVIAFFLAEMGDKTQIATVALAAQYAQSLAWVVGGTTLGMMIANVPAVIVGSQAAHKIPLKLVHSIAALIFVGLGVAVLLGVGSR